MTRWKAIVSIIAVFLLGALAGAIVAQRIYQQRIEGIIRGEPRTTKEFIVRRLNRELHLDAAQLEQLKAIVQETHTEMRNVRKRFRPQLEEILARSQDKIRAILRPDQLERYEKIVAERKKKWDKEDNGR